MDFSSRSSEVHYNETWLYTSNGISPLTTFTSKYHTVTYTSPWMESWSRQQWSDNVIHCFYMHLTGMTSVENPYTESINIQ